MFSCNNPNNTFGNVPYHPIGHQWTYSISPNTQLANKE